MPMGERAFADSKGPRKKITLLISSEAYLLLKVAAAINDTSATGQGVEVVESWAEDLLERDHEQLAAFLLEERARRAGASVGGD